MCSVGNNNSTYRIGVDGGGTKTELILVDEQGKVVARQVAPGCNPNAVGPDQARAVLLTALGEIHRGTVTHTHLYMAGAPAFWRELAAELQDFGTVHTADDSLPVLELATGGQPGIVLHGGTGSFVAARGPDGSVHYAGGLGWRFGDPGSGYDLGRRAIAQGLLELQGWSPATRLGPIVRSHGELGNDADAAALTRHFYQGDEPNKRIAALAPAVLHLASEGDPTARQLVLESAKGLLDLAIHVATRLFVATPLDAIPAGLSGPILTHPAVLSALASRSPLPLTPVTDAPILGVQRLLQRIP
ncbi:N-acetylglucosamine kinase [Actomonas aquatica]|uniref:BadF/BadG/BcrA/BcrD ATPase family protein n=1 Tax=Actomonas aquatica TaxID=2866162 RepID=A0ABZ1C6R3_9BACT|nr:BadF/BadG/BcrA/BcrD ATPase family protein [Opitutus sp. WL0086]WRQ86214.1 BadF/BadG/BcrA/BcrD ATPase family protein [Opitutus sp. WL0086]